VEAFKAKLPLLVQNRRNGSAGTLGRSAGLRLRVGFAWACELACTCAWFCASCWLRLLVAVAEAEALAVAEAEVPLEQLAEALAEAEAVAVAVKVAGGVGVLPQFKAGTLTYLSICWKPSAVK